MYGPDLLVAPMHTEGTAREVYFPAGRWVSFWDNSDVIEGPMVKCVEAPIDRIPVYVRQCALVPMRLSENLKPGASMTKTETSALLLSAGSGHFFRYTATNGGIIYDAVCDEDGAAWKLTGLMGQEYILVKGLSDAPARVLVNDMELPEQPVQHGLYFGPSWYRAADGFLMIRIPHVSELTLQIR